MRILCHLAPLLLLGCYVHHGSPEGEPQCEPPAGYVCCGAGGPISVGTLSCPFECPAGTRLQTERICRGLGFDASFNPAQDAGPDVIFGDSAVLWLDAGPDAGHPDAGISCPLARADFTCMQSFGAEPGVPFSLPVSFDQCSCCAQAQCAVRVDNERSELHLTTALCADPCDCDACATGPSVDCQVPALTQGDWKVLVNGEPAFSLPIAPLTFEIPPPPSACVAYAEGDACGADPLAGYGTHASELCFETINVSGLIEFEHGFLRVIDDCADCHSFESTCTLTYAERLDRRLPHGGELYLENQAYSTDCDIDCPGVCQRHERRCALPPLVRGEFYRVWRNGRVVMSFTPDPDIHACVRVLPDPSGG